MFRDSFDYYAVCVPKWTSSTGGATAPSTSDPRTGLYRCNCNQLTKVVGAAFDHATFIVGAAMKSIPASLVVPRISLMSDNGVTYHLTMNVNLNGSVEVRRGTTSGTVLGTSATGLFDPEVYNYFELKAVLGDAAAGSAWVQVNGVLILTITGVDTKNAGTKVVFDAFRIEGSSYISIDDVYANNGAGTINNDFNGDTEVIALFPTGAGANTGFTPSAGSNYQTVDEVPASTADYNTALADGLKDSYAYGNLSATSGVIRAATIQMLAAKVGTDPKYIRGLVRSGGADYEGTSQLLSTSYTVYGDTRELDPATAAAWAYTAINAAEFGVVGKDS
jgi:hypothetical protein